MSDCEFPRHVKLLLVAIGLTNSFSLKAHYPKEVIHKNFPVNIRKDQVLYSKATSKKTYKFLIQQRFIYKKQTAGGTTWALTKEGARKSKECSRDFL